MEHHLFWLFWFQNSFPIRPDSLENFIVDFFIIIITAKAAKYAALQGALGVGGYRGTVQGTWIRYACFTVAFNECVSKLKVKKGGETHAMTVVNNIRVAPMHAQAKGITIAHIVISVFT